MNIGAKQIMEKAKSILDSCQRDKGLSVSILQDTQAEYNYPT